MDVLDEEVREFQLRLEVILKEFRESGRIEVYGNLRIVVADIDRIACLKENTIYVNVKARTYPDFVLRYNRALCHHEKTILSRIPITAINVGRLNAMKGFTKRPI